MRKTMIFAAIAATLVSGVWAAPKTLDEMLEKEEITVTSKVWFSYSEHEQLRDYWGKKTSAVVGLDDAYSFQEYNNVFPTKRRPIVVFPKSLPHIVELENLQQQRGAVGDDITYTVVKFRDKYRKYDCDFYYVVSVDENSVNAAIDKHKSEIERIAREKDPEYRRQQAELKERESLAMSIARMSLAVNKASTDWNKRVGEAASYYCKTYHKGKSCPKLIFSNDSGWESHVAYWGELTLKENGKVEVRERELAPIWMADKNAVHADSKNHAIGFYEIDGDSIVILATTQTKQGIAEDILASEPRLAELRDRESKQKKAMESAGYVYDYMWTGEWIKRDAKVELDASLNRLMQIFGY